LFLTNYINMAELHTEVLYNLYNTEVAYVP
jgi:hypothetical protein